MSESLNNKIAIVTGASRGIGKAIALSLAKEGVKVVLAARNRDGLESVEGEVHRTGGQCMAVQTDVGEETHIERSYKEGDG